MNDKPVIGVFTKQLDNWTSGSGHHLNEMMRHVLALNRKLRFVFIHYHPSENPLYKQADEELIIPRNPLTAAKELRKHKFDVLHFTPLTIFAPIWKTPGKKMATIHGVEQLLVPQFYGPLEMVHERFLVPAYARKMDHIITVSETSKQYFIKNFMVKPEKVTVCVNAVNSTYRKLTPEELNFPKDLYTISGQSINANDTYVFHISRFSERKNPWTVLKGFAEFSRRSAGKNSKLVIAGGGWNIPSVNQEIKKLSIEDKTILAGFVDELKAVILYNAASVLVFPSLAEGFGMPNIEAMSCGCPVITSNIFAIPEIVGDAALIMSDPENYVDLADNLEKVFSDDNLRNELIRRGKEEYYNFVLQTLFQNVPFVLPLQDALLNSKLFLLYHQYLFQELKNRSLYLSYHQEFHYARWK